MATIRQHVDSLTANIEAIENQRPQLRRALSKNEETYRWLRYDSGKEIEAATVTSLDDQFRQMMTGDSEPGGSVQPSLTQDDMLRYPHTLILLSSGVVAVGKLLGGSLTSYLPSVQLIREDYDSAAQRVEHSVGYLQQHGPSHLRPEILSLVQEVLVMGGKEGGFWRDLDTRLELVGTEQRLITANGRILDELLHEVDLLVDEVNRRSDARTASAAQAGTTWRVVFLMIGIVGVLGTLAAAGYFGTGGSRT